MQLSPYLNFNGQCAEAFRFYAELLNGTLVTILTHGETPAKEHVPADWQDKVIHARLVVGDTVLMGCDAPPAYAAAPQGFSVSITVAEPAEAERIFKGLSENGRVTMPFAATFWSPAFGMTTDRFGIPWMVNCEPAAAAAA